MDTGLEKVSFQSNPKERQCQKMLKGSLSFFWLHWVFAAASDFSLVVASGLCSLAAVCGPLTAVASLVEHRDGARVTTSDQVCTNF